MPVAVRELAFTSMAVEVAGAVDGHAGHGDAGPALDLDLVARQGRRGLDCPAGHRERSTLREDRLPPAGAELPLIVQPVAVTAPPSL